MIIEGKEYLDDIIKNNKKVVFVSPHWGAFYSIPIILSRLNIKHIALSNGGESENLKKVVNKLTPECKDEILDIIPSDKPITALKTFKKYLNNNVSVLAYPEYTFGPKPKYTVDYFDCAFPTARGLAATAANNNVDIQPISLSKIDNYPHFKLEFYKPINTLEYSNVKKINKEMHKRLMDIVKKDPSVWWYWNLYNERRI